MDNFAESIPTFPNPPPFYTLYDPKGEYEPPLPPPPPEESSFLSFRMQFDLENKQRTLDDNQRLFPKDNYDSKLELKNLNKSLLYKFVELIEILISNPSENEKKTNEIQNIFINMYYLLNTHRGNQTRSFIIEYMKSQIEEKKMQIEKLELLEKENSESLKDLNLVLQSNKETDEEVEEEINKNHKRKRNEADIETNQQINHIDEKEKKDMEDEQRKSLLFIGTESLASFLLSK
eukprot:TRINITY_DN1567_c1_g1_i1.p1 TRINITY_DN1567_c1_g1~~TRINITY_DN1567_c1_g1_i1.p1  ORF type:complete len:234 (+),score=83.43 TRINITY_DN1567_c1_g1_i1:74-775(+)